MAKTLTERVVTNVDRETRDWIETEAARTDRTPAAILRQAIRMYRANRRLTEREVAQMDDSPVTLLPRRAPDLLADRIRDAARAVSLLPMLTPSNNVSVNVNVGEYPTVAATVHACPPSQLDAVLDFDADARKHVDADELLRCVEVDVEGVEVTFFRR